MGDLEMLEQRQLANNNRRFPAAGRGKDCADRVSGNNGFPAPLAATGIMAFRG
jgi:hypothetical protein